MKRFTYIEYLKYQEYVKNIDYFKNNLKEDSNKYNYEKKSIYYKHDKMFREVLEDKKEVTSFINKALNLQNTKSQLREQEIEKYNRKFITSNFKYAEMDIVYRKKGENIFFLIEHQSTIDYSMPYRILMYSLEIMKSIIDEEQIKKKGYILPMIYPIVLYTGNKRWNVERYIEAKQAKIPGCEPVRFYEYNVIDINQYSDDELLKDDMFLSKLMLLEKANTSKRILENLNKIIKEDLTEKNKIFLRRIISYIFITEIGKKESQKLLRELKNEKGGYSMIEELLRKGIREEIEKIKKVAKKEAEEIGKKQGMEKGKKEGVEIGKKEGVEIGKKEGVEIGKKEGVEIGKKEGMKIAQNELKKQWITKMITSNINEQEILKITEISAEELQKIKNEISEKT